VGGVVLLNVMVARSEPTVKRCKNTVSKDFRLCLKPILQGLTILLAARFIELLGARSHLAFYQLHHQSLLLFSACFDVHNYPYLFPTQIYDNRLVLTDHYIRLRKG
jgi:hypothetical protein